MRFVGLFTECCFNRGRVVYIKLGEEYADGELDLLVELLSLLDIKITELHDKIFATQPPNTDLYGDQVEYFIGIGFVAIQQYLNDTLTTIKCLKKPDALDLGPFYTGTLSYAAIFNASANYWKHFPEWLKSDDAIEKKQATRTQFVIGEIVNSQDWVLAGVLAKLTSDAEFRLSNLIPLLHDWRNNIDLQSSQAN